MKNKKYLIVIVAILISTVFNSCRKNLPYIDLVEEPTSINTIFAQVQQKWNDKLSEQIGYEFVSWQERKIIDTETTRQAIITEITDLDNIWLPDGNVLDQTSISIKHLSEYQEELNPVTLAEFTENIADKVRIGWRVFDVNFTDTVAEQSIEMIALVSPTNEIYNVLLNNTFFVEENPTKSIDQILYPVFYSINQTQIGSFDIEFTLDCESTTVVDYFFNVIGTLNGGQTNFSYTVNVVGSKVKVSCTQAASMGVITFSENGNFVPSGVGLFFINEAQYEEICTHDQGGGGK